MAATSALLGFYEQVAAIHNPSGVTAKITLLCALELVRRGNVRPGQRLLTIVFGLLLGMAFWIAADSDLAGDSGTSGSLPVAIISFVAAASLFVAALRPEGTWALRTATPWKNWLGLALVVTGVFYPAFGSGLAGRTLFSPLGALPHGVLLVATTAAWLSMPQAPRLAAWACLGASTSLALLDLAAAGATSSLVLAVPAALLGWELRRSVAAAGGVLEDDRPRRRVDLPPDPPRAKAPKTNDRTWKLK
jgi:hypothetical protein